MPRVAINKKKYLQTDLREWMKGRMDTLGKNQAYMGEKLSMSQQSFGKRLRNGNFNNVQLYVIFKELEATDEKILQLMKL
ncbi:hypothetical protein [uncultured Acetatifactor sp.]|jgi:hypothetical protein|uniref:hypothetical protein n=1 Tax=uncultured Acetatifactor sp. TaxID=1671927 RepID=UPI0025ED325A|nr:hypothetical protein [uncultured Acetatifactor sp.]